MDADKSHVVNCLSVSFSEDFILMSLKFVISFLSNFKVLHESILLFQLISHSMLILSHYVSCVFSRIMLKLIISDKQWKIYIEK